VRQDAKRDANEPAIVKALLAVGAAVERVNMENVPDLLVGFRKKTFCLEVKSEKGKLSGTQASWHKLWPGHAAVVRTPKEALKAIGYILPGDSANNTERWTVDRYKDELLRERAGLK